MYAETLKWRLHPLIHTSLRFDQAQDVEKKKAEPRTPDLFSLNQDIVPGFEEEKWGLKYAIFSFSSQSQEKAKAGPK